MPDDTFGRVADDELANIVETTSRENDVERPYTWGLIRSALLELQQHRARIAAHAAAHPERLSDERIALIVEADATEYIEREDGYEMALEIQQRRAADLTAKEIEALESSTMECPTTINSIIDKLLRSHGVDP